MTTAEEVQAFNEAFSQAIADRDVDRLVAVYTDDACLLFEGSAMIKGRAAIAAFFAPIARAEASWIRFESADVREAGDLVVDVGRYQTPDDRGKYVVVYERQPDGSLRLAVDSATSDSRPETTPAARDARG
jgi:uncharacterized protein (TIGR02246 family)